MVKATRAGRAYQYAACLTEQEYLNLETKRFIRDVHRGSVFGLINALCDSGDLTKEDLEELINRLQEQRGRHE